MPEALRTRDRYRHCMGESHDTFDTCESLTLAKPPIATGYRPCVSLAEQQSTHSRVEARDQCSAHNGAERL
jgi:hypothetical protein